ncbi:MAG: hypothetical protein K0Q90_2677, partial [Paenibacillaceae bacterium]|nr:hypothetical protein [Paenibacillaceae bacterium]
SHQKPGRRRAFCPTIFFIGIKSSRGTLLGARTIWSSHKGRQLSAIAGRKGQCGGITEAISPLFLFLLSVSGSHRDNSGNQADVIPAKRGCAARLAEMFLSLSMTPKTGESTGGTHNRLCRFWSFHNISVLCHGPCDVRIAEAFLRYPPVRDASARNSGSVLPLFVFGSGFPRETGMLSGNPFPLFAP